MFASERFARTATGSIQRTSSQKEKVPPEGDTLSLVSLVEERWNHIRDEIVRWIDILGDRQGSYLSPVATRTY